MSSRAKRGICSGPCPLSRSRSFVASLLRMTGRALFPKMPRITRVYTRTGDDGTTGLGSGGRIGKDSPRIEAYGTVDELNSQIGLALATGLDEGLAAALRSIQNELFHLGSDLCVLEEEKKRRPVPGIEER